MRFPYLVFSGTNRLPGPDAESSIGLAAAMTAAPAERRPRAPERPPGCAWRSFVFPTSHLLDPLPCWLRNHVLRRLAG